MQQEAAKLIAIPDASYKRLDQTSLRALSVHFSRFVNKRIPSPQNAREAKAIPPLLVVAAPRQLVAEDNESFWLLLVGRHTSGQRNWEVSWRNNGRLVAVNLASGEVSIHFLEIRERTSDKRYVNPVPSRTGVAPNDFHAATTSAGVSLYRPLDYLPFPDTGLPARVALTVFWHDCGSNTVITTLDAPEGEAPPGRPDASARRREWRTPGIEPVEAGQNPSECGGSIRVRANRFEPGGPAMVEVVLASLPEQDATIAEDRESPSGGFLLSVSLLLIQLDSELPAIVSLWVPGKRLEGGSIGTSFSFLPANLPGAARLSGHFQLWIVAGSRVLGPEPVSLRP